MQEIIEESKMLELTVIEKRIKQLENQLKELKDREEKIKVEIINEMSSNNVMTLENEELKISYVKPIIRSSVDASKLKSEYPEVYKDCLKLNEVKENLRIKIKEN